MFQVYNKTPQPQPIYLRLEQKPDGVAVVICNSHGDVLQRLVRITNDGKLMRYRFVDDPAIQRDDCGRILIQE